MAGTFTIVTMPDRGDLKQNSLLEESKYRMPSPRRPFRLNVGFLIHEAVGYSHEFEFELEEARVGPDLELRDFSFLTTIDRTTQGLLFTGEFSARTTAECVRCLKAFELDLKCSFTELYTFREKASADTELIVPEDAHIDLQPLIRDYALLEIPISPICRPACRGLCSVCGQDLNLQDCGHRAQNEAFPFSILKGYR